MPQLTPDEARVLGVLIEKALTTPEQYPLTLNAIVAGSNQKNNRDPLMGIDENAAFEAVEGLRSKGLAVRVDSVGSRVNRYRHNAGDALRVRTGEAAVFAELLLRGPQTLGELRGRASRMHPFESLEAVKEMLRALSERGEPLVRELPPSPGSRAERYAQLLCPECHPQAEGQAHAAGGTVVAPAAGSVQGGLGQRVERLEAEVSRLRDALRRLALAVGEADPLGGDEAPPSPDATGVAGGGPGETGPSARATGEAGGH